MQPVHGTFDIPQTKEQPITLQKTGNRHTALLTTLIALVHLAQRVRPERSRFVGGMGAETETRDHAAPDFIHDKVRGWHGASPLVEEWGEQGRWVPAALGAGVRRFIIHRGAQRHDSEDLHDRV